MKSKLLSAAVLVMVMLDLNSCKKPVSPLAEFVPKDAATVFTVDLKAMTDKIAGSGISIDSFVNLFSYNNDEDALHWSDIKNSGIDLDIPFFIFSNQTNSIQGGTTKSLGLVAEIEDRNKLIAFLKNQNPGTEVASDNNYEYLNLKNGFVAGWTDKVLIISGVMSGTANNGNAALSHQQLTTLFTQKESASIASNGEFGVMLKKPGDIHFWVNASANMGSLGMLGITRLGTLFQDTYTEGTISFENGKAVASSESHFNKALSDILSKYPSKEINKTMISRYPGPMKGFGIIALNPKVLLDILHYLSFDVMSDGYLSQMGFTMADIVNAFKGDIAVIYSDVNVEKETVPGNGTMHLPGAGQFLLNAAIGDKAAFDRVMNGLVKQQILSKNGNRYQLGIFGGHDLVIEATNENFFIASDDALLKSYQTGDKKSALSPDVEEEISNKSMAVYIDIARILDASKTLRLRDTYYGFPDSDKTWQAARSTFKNFIAITDKGDGKTMRGSLEVNMVNSGENSLAGIAKFLAIAHDEELKHRRNMHPPFSADSIPNMQTIPEEKDSE